MCRGLYLQAGLHCILLSPPNSVNTNNGTDLAAGENTFISAEGEEDISRSLCFQHGLHVLWCVMWPHLKAVFHFGKMILCCHIDFVSPSGHGNLFETDPPSSFLSFTLCPPGFCPLSLNLPSLCLYFPLSLSHTHSLFISFLPVVFLSSLFFSSLFLPSFTSPLDFLSLSSVGHRSQTKIKLLMLMSLLNEMHVAVYMSHEYICVCPCITFCVCVCVCACRRFQ